MYKKIAVSILSTMLIGSSLFANNMPIKYSDISEGVFRTKTISGLRSMNSGEQYTIINKGWIEQHNFETGKFEEILFDNEKFSPIIKFTDYEFSGDESKILLTTNVKPTYRHSFSADYWVFDRKSKSLKPLSERGSELQATFSPKTNKVAFVRDNNIFISDLTSGELTQVTNDGKFNQIINGIPDWVYEEEFGFSRAFEWSPDGNELAYMHFDESRVKEYDMTVYGEDLYPKAYRYKYPKAGEENSIVEVHRYNLKTGVAVKVDLGTQTDQYIPRIKWTSTGDLIIYRLNRLQNHFELISANKGKVIYSEKNTRYVERVDDQTVTFLLDGRMIIKSEQNGFMHLYLYDAEGDMICPITSGRWEVTELIGVNNGRILYLSTEGSPLGRNLYSISIDGDKKQLTTGKGTYSIQPSKGFKYFIRNFSDIYTPNQISLHSGDGKLIRVLEDNAALKNHIQNKRIPVKEFFSFTTSEGVTLNGYIIKPPLFDPKKKHPLFMTQYSGPGSQQVADKWGIDWEYVLADQGYFVACIDGRGTGFRGEEFKKCTYRNLGKLETEDQIEAARYFGRQTYIDPERIGIYGWSYGGFMALNCILKGADLFKMAIAVAPVASWRFYDTIYTEIYNGLPNENPHGYDDNSPINHAEKLKGKLLIAHGTGDDNVHVQNTYRMVSKLTENGKKFDLLIYPDENHGMGASRDHLMERIIEYVKTNL